jgi:hypothetical protein
LLHAAAVARVGSHAAPTVVPSGWHVPIVIVIAFAPTHDNPTPHGAPLSHAPPCASGAVQTFVAVGQTRFGPHAGAVAHESPAFGCAAHVPHAAPVGSEHHALWHCASKKHDAPAASEPLFGMHAAGGLFAK